MPIVARQCSVLQASGFRRGTGSALCVALLAVQIAVAAQGSPAQQPARPAPGSPGQGSTDLPGRLGTPADTHPRTGQRELSRDPKKSIQSQLLADDTEITIVDPSPPGSTSGLPPGKTAIEVMTGASDLVAVGRVSGIEGRLTRNGDFVESVVQITLLESIKGEAKNSRQAFVIPGGELQLGKTRVKGIKGYGSSLKPGEQVMVFAVSLDGELRSNLRSVFRVKAGKLEPLEPHPGVELDSESGNNLDSVIAKARAAAGMRR